MPFLLPKHQFPKHTARFYNLYGCCILFFIFGTKNSVYILIFLSVPQQKRLQPEEETEEEKQFIAIYQQIAGEVSRQRGERSV